MEPFAATGFDAVPWRSCFDGADAPSLMAEEPAKRMWQKRKQFEGAESGTVSILGGVVEDHALRAVHGGNFSSSTSRDFGMV